MLKWLVPQLLRKRLFSSWSLYLLGTLFIVLFSAVIFQALQESDATPAPLFDIPVTNRQGSSVPAVPEQIIVRMRPPEVQRALLQDPDAVVLDVRPGQHFHEVGHIAGSISIPLDELSLEQLAAADISPEKRSSW
ncbi:MAG: rhodanese-like domain-containing protein [Anaerolineae bacterium]|nr:rhodanese-like domain-containing protein [Anaerolineae bacterium]